MSEKVLVSRVDLEALFAGFTAGVWVVGAGYALPGDLREINDRARAARDNLYRALHGDALSAAVDDERERLISEVGDCCKGADPYCAGGCLVARAVLRLAAERSRRTPASEAVDAPLGREGGR